MKKFFKILALTITILMIVVPVFANSGIRVQLNGEYVDFTDAAGNKVEPQIINDRTMVPMRKIFEVFGADVEWIPETRSIKSNCDGLEINLQINNNLATVKDTNGVTKEIQLDSAPTIVNDRTLVPVRFIAESLDKKVDWDSENRIVIIKDKKDDMMDQAMFSAFRLEMGSLKESVRSEMYTMKGKEAINGTIRTDAQLYNFIARGGYNVLKETDWLKEDEASNIVCTKIDFLYAEKSIGINLPNRKVKNEKGENIQLEYFVTPKGNVFCWPPYEYDSNHYVTADVKVAKTVEGARILNFDNSNEIIKIVSGSNFIRLSKDENIDDNNDLIIESGNDNTNSNGNPISKIYSNAKISANLVNVYKESNTNSEIVGKLEKNTIVIAQQYENDWSKVSKGNITGWVKTENINFKNDVVESQKAVLNSKIEVYKGEITGVDVKTLIRSVNMYNANELFPNKLTIRDNTLSGVKLINNTYSIDGINNSSRYIIELTYNEEGYVKEIIINKEKNDVVNYKISDGYTIDLNKWKRVESSLITENMTKEINSDGKNIKLKFEINSFPSKLKIYLNDKKYTYGENEYANYSIAFVDLDEDDKYKEIEIAIQNGIHEDFQTYRIKQNGLELLSNSALLYNKETKQYISGLKNVIDSVNPSPVLGYYLYVDGEFKYIDKFPNGEEIVDENGNFNSNFQKQVFTVGVEARGLTAENLYEQIEIKNFSDRALMEKVALAYAKIRFKKMYQEKNERGFIETKYDIEIIENHDARYYDENNEKKYIIVPAGTILKEITSWSHAGGTYYNLMYIQK